jgi:hypothetical protein
LNKCNSLGINIGVNKRYINFLFYPVERAYKWANQVPDLDILLFSQSLGPLIVIFEVPPFFSENNFLKLLPCEIFAFPNDLVIIYQLMTSESNCFVIQFMPVSSEALNLMTFLASMYSICENITIVDLVALPSAEGAHLVTSKSSGSHFLVKVSDELIIL